MGGDDGLIGGLVGGLLSPIAEFFFGKPPEPPDPVDYTAQIPAIIKAAQGEKENGEKAVINKRSEQQALAALGRGGTIKTKEATLGNPNIKKRTLLGSE